MGRIALAIAIALFASPARAEVCDKERPGWIPADGAVSPVGESMFVFTTPVGLTLLGLSLAALVSRWRWLSAVCAAASLAIAGALIADRVAPLAGVSDATAAEGCAASPILAIAALVALAVAVALAGFRRR